MGLLIIEDTYEIPISLGTIASLSATKTFYKGAMCT